MSPIRHEGDRKIPIRGWESHVDQMIREAQARGEFDNLPGTGQPLPPEMDNPFAGELQAAFRVAKNAGAAPLWVQLDREIGEDTAALAALVERTARYLQDQATRLRAPGAVGPGAGGPTARPSAPPAPPASRGRLARWNPFARRRPDPSTSPAAETYYTRYASLADLEAERQRARALYLAKAADLDKKILEFNAARPRNLSWLEKTRLLPGVAARQFDSHCPPIVE